MREQYRVAGEFLDHLTRRFLSGDRSRIIIIPGNHDVCWNTSFSAMKRVPEDQYPKDLRAAVKGSVPEFRNYGGLRAVLHPSVKGPLLTNNNERF